MRTLVFGRIHRCARTHQPAAHLAGRADNGAAIYVIPGRNTSMRRSTPEYVQPDAYVPWPHGQEGMPVEHRRRRVSPRVRALILVLVGVVLGFLALGAVAAFADEPDPQNDPGVSTGSPAVPQATPPPARPEDDMVLSGDVVWGRRA